MKQQIHSGLWLVGYHGGGGFASDKKKYLGDFFTSENELQHEVTLLQEYSAKGVAEAE